MPNACILDDKTECLGLTKSKHLEDEINEFRRQNSRTHDRIFDRLSEVDKSISKLETLYNSLEGLPGTIANLDKTITIIGGNLESMDRNILEMKNSIANQANIIHGLQTENKAQTEHIHKIDNKSKIDWAEFVTHNFWKIFVIIGVGYAVIKTMISGG